MTEDEIIGWYHRLDGHEFEQAPGGLVMDREAGHAIVHGFAKSQTRLSDELIECSWDSQGKYSEVVFHSLLQWSMFCQNSPL